MDVFVARSLTEQYILSKREMDSQLGALTAARSSSTKTRDGKTPLRQLDPETDYKVRKITSRVNECIQLAANEPSLGLFRIQEHVHRTMPHLIDKKVEMKKTADKLDGALYDLDLSIDVVDSLSGIRHFTRIKEALRQSIDLQILLNQREEEAKRQRELDASKAQQANRSLSVNEPAEGYICPVCYYALTSQDELIAHWQDKHNLGDCDNDVFQEAPEDTGFSNDKDLTVIEMPVEVGETSSHTRTSSMRTLSIGKEEYEDAIPITE